ncbi:MAG: hypothetical protein JST40_08555 [Armatimonadetes bacterium]|nr:hypothetical protein [Armatimonadota bacterium]
MRLFLGIDCGGSSTRARCEDESGIVVFEGCSGPGNWSTMDHTIVLAHIQEAVEGCPQPNYVAVCMAGLLCPESQQELEQKLVGRFPQAVITAVPDYFAALGAAGQAKAVVIAGTGTLICTEAPGFVARFVSNGPILGDRGSVMDLGRIALQMLDHSWQATVLLSNSHHLQELFGEYGFGDYIGKSYAAASPSREFAKAGVAAARDADQGCEWAQEACSRAIQNLADDLVSFLKMPELQGVSGDVVLTGGLWDISHRFKLELEQLIPSETFRILEVPPVVGAVAVAKNSI